MINYRNFNVIGHHLGIKQNIFKVLLILLVITTFVSISPTKILAAAPPPSTSAPNTSGGTWDLFLSPAVIAPIDGVKLFVVNDGESNQKMIKAEIALFNGGTSELVIPEGVRILVFSQKPDVNILTKTQKQTVEVMTSSPLTIPGRSDGDPGFKIIPVYFKQYFLKQGLNELIYTVDPDNEVQEEMYEPFFWYQRLLIHYGGSIWDFDYGSDHFNKIKISELMEENFGKPVEDLKNMSDLQMVPAGRYISGEANNKGEFGKPTSGLGKPLVKTRDTLKLYHPSSYPDLVIKDIRIEPETPTLFGDNVGVFSIEVDVMNIGGYDINNGFGLQHCSQSGTGANYIEFSSEPEGIKVGETITHKIEYNLQGQKIGVGDQSQIQIQIQDRSTFFYPKEISPGGVKWKKQQYSGWSKPVGESPSSADIEVAGRVMLTWEDQELVKGKKTLVSSKNWAAILNSPIGWLGADWISYPLEIGSENHSIPHDWHGWNASGHCFSPNFMESPNGGNKATITFKLQKPKLSVIYPDDEHIWKLGTYMPVYNWEGWLPSGLPAVTSIENCIDPDTPPKDNKRTDRTIAGVLKPEEHQWSYECGGYLPLQPEIWGAYGHVSSMLVDENFSITQEWVDGWENSLLSFRWLPIDNNSISKQEGFQQFNVQVFDDAETLIYETIVQPAGVKSAFLDGLGHLGTGIKYMRPEYDGVISQYWSDVALKTGLDQKMTLMGKGNLKGFGSQWVYDGPPLKPGEYSFRVGYKTNVPESPDDWSEKVTFFLEPESLSPDDSIRLRDTNLSDEIHFSGTITGLRPNGLTILTESGLSIDLNTSADTIISSAAKDIRAPLIPGRKVKVTSPEVPYISGRAYVPLNKIPVASEITDLIRPEMIYPRDKQVFQLGQYPPIEKDWALCASQECDPKNLLLSPGLESQEWKSEWIDSLLRFRWIPILNTENAQFKLRVQNNNGDVVYETEFASDLTGEGFDGTFNGVGIDEKQWLEVDDEDDPGYIMGYIRNGLDETAVIKKQWFDRRHYVQLFDHYYVDMRVPARRNGLNDPQDFTKKSAAEMAKQGKFYQYVYDGPILEPGEYSWQISYIQDDLYETEIWSPPSSFTLKAPPFGPPDPPKAQQAPQKEDVVFSGKVMDIVPNGFTVATKSGLIFVRTDTETIFYSPLTQFHDSVDPTWKVKILAAVEPYIVDHPYMPEDGKIFRGEVTDIRPEGFSVSTKHGLVHMATNTDTVIHSANTGSHEEVPMGWKVHFLSQETPYISGRAYVPLNKIPVATDVIEQIPGATHVYEYVTNNKHKRCTAVEKIDAEKTAFSCDDGDYVELNESDIPDGASVVLLFQNDSAKLISTASDLYDRMERFKSLADSNNNTGLSSQINSYQQQANSGFNDGFEQAKANASPAVLTLLEAMSGLPEKIIALASSLMSGSEQLIFDDNDISELTEQLEQFAASYENIIDLVVYETLGDMSKEDQGQVKTDIKNVSTQFLSNMQSDFVKIINALKQGDLTDAITLLEIATANEEKWQSEVVLPRINLQLALNLVEEVKEELILYGDMLADSEKENLLEKYNALNKAIIEKKTELMPLIEDLWIAIEKAWESSNDEGGDALEPADVIKTAEAEIAEYKEYMGEGVEKDINSKIEDLKNALIGDDEQLIEDAMEALMKALSSYGGDSQNEDGQDKGADLILTAEAEIAEYKKYMGEGVEKDINSKIEDLKNALIGDEEEVTQKAIEALANALSSYGSDSQDEDGQDKGASEDDKTPPTDKLIQTANMTLSIADEIIANFKNDLPSELGTELTQKTELLREILNSDDKTHLLDAFNALTSLLEALKNYGPEGKSTPEHGSSPKSGFSMSIEIECTSTIEVGKDLNCSSKYNKNPDTITWSSPGGEPPAGVGDKFGTAFSTEGEFSISVQACIGSSCVTDIHNITVIPVPEPTS